MKVDPTRRSGVANIKRSSGSAKGVSGEFARLLQAGSGTDAVSGPTAAAPVDSLLAVQEVSDEGGGGKENAQQRAELMLDRLEKSALVCCLAASRERGLRIWRAPRGRRTKASLTRH
jgi:hypothetical protein